MPILFPIKTYVHQLMSVGYTSTLQQASARPFYAFKKRTRMKRAVNSKRYHDFLCEPNIHMFMSYQLFLVAKALKLKNYRSNTPHLALVVWEAMGRCAHEIGRGLTDH
jgi:hypothetical protein